MSKRKHNKNIKGKDAEERLNLLKKKKKTQMIYIAIIACIIMASITFFILSNNGVIVTNDENKVETIDDQNDRFVYIDQLDISNNQLHYYEYIAENNKNVRYFLVKASDGSIKGALDLCVKLHPEKSGWMLYQDYYVVCKDEMCSYPIVSIGNNRPSCCKPIALSIELVEEKVRISTDELEVASQYF